jgi:hypothetical protein
MRTALALGVLGLSLTVMLGGCASDGRTTGEGASLAEPVPILEHYAGNQAQNLEMQRRLLIRTAEQFQQLNAPALDEIDIDWDTQDLVLVAMGMRSTGGYWCRITAAQLQGQTLFVQGVVNRPGSSQMTTQAITYPWCAAVIPNVEASDLAWDLMNAEGKSPGDL